MLKHKIWRKLNSFVLVAMFVFSSLFALTGCTTSNIYSGIIYKQEGGGYLRDEIATPILMRIFDEYGLANKQFDESGQLLSNNIGSASAAYLRFGCNAQYAEDDQMQIANDLSKMKYIYHKKVDDQYIVICTTRILSESELGTTNTNGMIVDYIYGGSYNFQLKSHGDLNQDSTLNYGSENLDITDMTRNIKLEFDYQGSPINVNSNSVYRYELTENNNMFYAYTAYIFLGTSIGGSALNNPKNVVEGLYNGLSRANVIEQDIRSITASNGEDFTPKGSWTALNMNYRAWNMNLTEYEESRYNKFESRKTYFLEKYIELFTVELARVIATGGQGELQGQAYTAYTNAINIINEYVNNVNNNTKYAAENAAITFLNYIAGQTGVSLYYEEGEEKIIASAIFKTVIGVDIFNIPLSLEATEIVLSSAFFKNYVAIITEIVQKYVYKGGDLYTKDAQNRGYFLEQTGFTGDIYCSLSAVYFAQYDGNEDLFTTARNNLPGFTILFESDKFNTERLKNYRFYLYYHKRGEPTLATRSLLYYNFLIQLPTKDEKEFLSNLDDGVIYVDPNLAFKNMYEVKLSNSISTYANPMLRGQITQKNFGTREIPNEVWYFDARYEDNYFEFVELIMVPESRELIAEMKILDIFI